MASASIGQVHRARLRSGEPVVVKVQHADIEERVRVDLDILVGLAQLAERIPEFDNYRPAAAVAEFQRTLRRELDFGREERNMQQFAHDFGGDPTVRIPRSYPELCTSRVLTMEWLDGVKLSTRRGCLAGGFDLDEVARRGAELYLQMIFGHGFYHADPHPGNLMLLPGNVIGLLDFGMVGRIDERLREDIEEMLVALSHRDAEHLTSIICRVGSVPPHLDQAGLSLDVADFVSHYATQPLDDFDLSGALNEIDRDDPPLPHHAAGADLDADQGARDAGRHGPAGVAAVQPDRSHAAVPAADDLAAVFAGAPAAENAPLYGELEHLAEILPRGLTDILEQVQSGKFDVHLDHRGLEPSVNRLVLGMLASALFLGSSLLLSRDVPPLIHFPLLFDQLSVPGALGCAVAIALGLRLLRAINKSGHLDQRR